MFNKRNDLTLRNSYDSFKEIKKKYTKNLKFFYVDTIQEVLEMTLCKQKIKNAVEWDIEEDTSNN